MERNEMPGQDSAEQAVAERPTADDQPAADEPLDEPTTDEPTTDEPTADEATSDQRQDVGWPAADGGAVAEAPVPDWGKADEPTAEDSRPEWARPDETAELGEPAQAVEAQATEAPADEAPPAEAPPAEALAVEQAPKAEAAPRPVEARPFSEAGAAATGRPRTKLVCTIGPATIDRIRELVDAGMDVARINFSHGSPETHKQAIDAVRSAAHHARRSVAVMVDLPGPKIRLGEVDGDELELQSGHSFLLRRGGGPEGPGTERAADVSHDGLAELLEPGDRILLSDGAAELRVTAIAPDGAGVETEVVRGGTIRSRSGVNIPSERLRGPAMTEQDLEAVPRALALRADLIAQSFVRNAADVAELRALLPAGSAPPIVVKIETRAAVENFDEIVAAADGVMIARGDLGVDLPFQDIPLIQKDLLRRAAAYGKFTIVATQMLESMTAAPRPTRAEASDVANAVLDGADAVMLSAETAIGSFPMEAANAMVSISIATERDGADQLRATAGSGWLPTDIPGAIAQAASMLADSNAAPTAIWCFTRTGRTAEMLSALRPQLPIVAFTLSPIVARRLAPLHAVVPVVLSATRTNEPLIRRMESAARAQRVNYGSGSATVVLVTTSGQPDGVNRVELHRV